MNCSSQKPDCGSYQILTCCRDKRKPKTNNKPPASKREPFVSGRKTADMYKDVNTGHNVYLFMVNGWRAGCCLGIQMILGELRLGLPSPELPILLVLPLIPMPWPTWEWFSMFLEFIGNVPLVNHQRGLTHLPFPLLFPFINLQTHKQQFHTHLLGDGGVWRDMAGTPVVGVIWLGGSVPCVKFRFNWGVLLPMPLTEKPSAPA